MEITYKTLHKMWEHPDFRNAGFDYADEYGEPGYSLPYGASEHAAILLANWNIVGDKYPRLMAALEHQGFQLEWSDEWIIAHDGAGPSKCYRTQPDSYSWQSSILWTDGDFLTPEDGIDAWIAEVVNQPRRCLPSNVWNAADLAAAGFVQWMPDDPQQYESGWHPGQTDDPEEITRQIRTTAGYADCEVVFLLDEASQFYVGFSAWTRGADVVHYHAGHNIPGYLPMDDGPAVPMDWDGARTSLVVDLESYADDVASWDDDDDRRASLLASLEEAIAEVRATEHGEDIYVNVCSDGAHDLGLSYWVTACSEEECSEEEE